MPIPIAQLMPLQKKPALFTPGEPLFWDDPHISSQMLKVHLDAGTDAASLHDVEGRPLVQQMIELATTQGEGTVDYVWRNPVTNAVEQKRTFIRREQNTLIGVGFYRE